MNSEDDPFAAGDKTIIRPPTESPARGLSGRSIPSPPPIPRQPEETVIARSPSLANDVGSHGGNLRTVIAEPLNATAQRKEQEQEMLPALPDGVGYPGANPFVAAAAPLLILLGRLPQMHAPPLMDRIAAAIRDFEHKMAGAGIPAEEVRIATYALCETADDIARNLPGADGPSWAEKSMLATFFGVKTSGVGFFEALNRLLADPAPHHDLLELMHACLSLGFEGQYRGRMGGSLQRVRSDVHETLRHIRPATADDVPPEPPASPKRSRRAMLWIAAIGAPALLAAVYVTLAFVIGGQADALANRLLALSPPVAVTLDRAGLAAPTATPDVPPGPTRIERIRAALAPDIEAGGLAVEARGGFIVVEINNLLLFRPGGADLRPEFEPVAERVAAVLDQEPGSVTIVGHTDNVQPGRSSAFRSNQDLSVARARSVERMLAARMGDTSRLTVEGRGDEEPIADNATPEGRAANRRVDLLLAGEEAP